MPGCASWIPSTTALVLVLSSAGCADETDPFRASAEAAAAGIEQSWIGARLSTLAADAMEGRDNNSPGGKKARQYLIAELKAIGLEPAGDSGSYEQAFTEGVNLVARLSGQDPNLAREVVVLSAHYDHLGRAGQPNSQCSVTATAPGDTICNGAADNAAGVAAVLAVARALAGSDGGTRRTLLVIFWDAEEDGLLGSGHYAAKAPLVPLARTALMITVDTLGSQLFRGYDTLFAFGLEQSSGGLEAAVKTNNTVAGQQAHAVSTFFSGPGSSGRSDHAPFQKERVPFIFYSAGVPPEYHTPADELSVVDLSRVAGTARHVLLTTADAANAAVRQTFVDDPRPRLDDARALIEIGEAVLKDPAAVGLTSSDGTLLILDKWLDQLRAYLAAPPTTEQGWQDYQSLVQGIVKMVYVVMGR